MKTIPEKSFAVMGSNTIWECVVSNDLLLVKGSNMRKGERRSTQRCVPGHGSRWDGARQPDCSLSLARRCKVKSLKESEKLLDDIAQDKKSDLPVSRTHCWEWERHLRHPCDHRKFRDEERWCLGAWHMLTFRF